MTPEVAPMAANIAGQYVHKTTDIVQPMMVATQRPWEVTADTAALSSREAAAAIRGVVVYRRKFHIKFEKLYSIVARPTAARHSVPRCPTMAVSTTPIKGSKRVLTRAGIDSIKISLSHGDFSFAHGGREDGLDGCWSSPSMG